MGNPVISLVCPHCGKLFPSAMQMDPDAFEAIKVENMRERCPACLRASRFNDKDYFFLAEDAPS